MNLYCDIVKTERDQLFEDECTRYIDFVQYSNIIEKELNDNDVAVILNSIKKTYKHISSKIEFKFYGNCGGYLIPYVSSYTQDSMLQFKYLKKCIERGDEKIELELLYPQTFQFWTNLFIESGLFSSVYLKTDELNLTNGKDGK